MKKNLFLAALAIAALASCSDDTFVGDASPTNPDDNGTAAIVFNSNAKGITRADFIGATAAEKLGNMFVVEGTKGSEGTNSPSTTVVFDNYLVGYTANTAATTESNTNNWEYVGKEAGITSRLTAATWSSLHSEDGNAKSQTVKYWDYSTSQYDFIAWSTGGLEAVTDAAASGTKVKVTRINTGTTLASDGFTLTALSAADLSQCYYTDINTVTKEKYGQPVTLTFKNMAAKVRVALYETVPGYSVKAVKFYTAEEATQPIASGAPQTNAYLFTTGSDVLPQSGAVTVFYPHIGTNHRGAVTGDATYPNPTKDYNKASVTVGTVSGGATDTKQLFGDLTGQYGNKEANEAAGTIYLGRTLPTATYAGTAADNYYTAVIPNTNGKPLTLRVDYTLVATDGSGEEINVYGAKAVVPATYTVWQPNYAYTYIFKISDNTNGWTSQVNTDPKGLFPITFDAVVTSITDFNAEQTTVTTVATPSITTYQQGHDHANKDEYSKSQKAGISTDVKDVYVQVMDNSGATPTLKADLNGTNKSLLFAVSKTNASEAEVMDALQNRTSDWDENIPVTSPVGRNGITLTTNANISNTETSIVNGVDDQPITKIAGTAIAAGQVAKIDIDQLDAGTYAYVYCTTVPSTNEKVYHLAAATSENFTNYYPVTLTLNPENPEAVKDAGSKAIAGKVYFVPNKDAKGTVISYTFKQTKVNDDVEGLVEKSIGDKATAGTYESNPLTFYFDVYNKNNGAYAVKVIKVVN